MKFDQKCYLRNKFTKVIVYNQVLERVGVIVELSSEVKPIIFAFFFFFAMARMGVQLSLVVPRNINPRTTLHTNSKTIQLSQWK